jgi:hypothetical protein
MEFLHHLVVSVTSPVNCAVNLGKDVVLAVGQFVTCVVSNIQGIV